MKNKALIWTMAIVGIGLAGYIAYVVAKNNADKNKLLLSQNLTDTGNWIASLFKKSQESPTTELAYKDYSDPVFSRTDLAGLSTDSQSAQASVPDLGSGVYDYNNMFIF